VTQTCDFDMTYMLIRQD